MDVTCDYWTRGYYRLTILKKIFNERSVKQVELIIEMAVCFMKDLYRWGSR